MKPIVKKILESGLVDKHTALLMEKWKSIDSGAADLVGTDDIKQVSESSLLQFAEEIEEMIEGERNSLQETKLSISVGEPMLVAWVSLSEENRTPNKSFLQSDLRTKVIVFRDEMGNFVFPPEAGPHMRIMNRFQTTDGAVWTIVEAIPLHSGSQRFAYQVSADCVVAGATLG